MESEIRSEVDFIIMSFDKTTFNFNRKHLSLNEE